MSDAKPDAPAEAKGQHEPSMEEILASIRRIIAEDGEAAEGTKGDEAKPAAAEPPPVPAAAAAAPPPAPAAAAPEDDVLELTEVVEEEPVAQTSETPQMEAEPDRPEPPAPAVAERDDRLVSSTSAAVSVAALSQLVNRPRERGGELPLGDADRTLEGMVRELLRPMLKDWLDENLPPLVERLVRDEITRLVRDAQGR